MKGWRLGLSATLALLVLMGAYVVVQLRSLEVERLSDDLYVMRGLGGNVMVLRTDAGTVIVDTMSSPIQGALIREAAKTLTGADTVLLISTHYHLDHTHGNPAFDAGTRVLSTERTLSHLKALDAAFWTDEAAQLLPNETFNDRYTLSIGGKTLELIEPGRGHTDGDLVVLFVDEKVIATGDLFFNRFYPNIDLEAGGSVQLWPQTLEQILSLDFERVIPGHGATSDRQGLQQFKAFMSQLGAAGLHAGKTGASLEQTLAEAELTADEGYQSITFIVPLGLDRDFVLTRSWEEVTGNYTQLN